MKADIEALRLNFILTRNNVKGHSEKIKELEGMIGNAPPVPIPIPSGGGDQNIDINALGQIFAS